MPRKDQPYTLRYGILSANQLSDTVLVRSNPSYGEKIGEDGSRPVSPDISTSRKLEAETGFYTRLEGSILANGIRNPIFCESIEEGTFVVYGSCRLWFAKKHKLPIPCVIADYVDRWDLEVLETREEILEKYLDLPGRIELSEVVTIEACPHVHLDS